MGYCKRYYLWYDVPIAPTDTGAKEVQVDVAQRFNELWEPVPESGCWLWTGSFTSSSWQSYGRFFIGRGAVLAHRLSYALHKGQIPKGMMVCHKCDTPACVNPDHLFAGSAKDNVLDAIAKGRFVPVAPQSRAGIKRPHRPRRPNYSAEVIRDVKENPDRLSERLLAEKHGISKGSIYRIKRMETN